MAKIKKNGFEYFKDLYLAAKKAQLPSAVLLSGAEEYPIVSFLRMIREEIAVPEINVSEYGDVFSYESVAQAFDAVPMMSEYRLVIFHKTGYFKWNRDERFHALFSKIPSHVRLVVFEQELNKISANYKRFPKEYEVVLDRVTKPYLTNWIVEEYRQRLFGYEGHFSSENGNRGLRSEIVGILADIGLERGMFELKHALDYLASLPWEISGDDVDHYFKRSSDTTVWALYGSLSAGNLVETLSNLLDSEDAFELFGRMNALIRNIYRYKRGVFQGTPYMTGVVSAASEKMSTEQAAEMMRILSRIDVEMKSTGASREDLLMQIALEGKSFRR